MANGQATKGLIDIIQQAGAQVAGVGIIIEKSFQDGRKLLLDAGVPVTSLARIEKFQDGQVVLRLRIFKRTCFQSGASLFYLSIIPHQRLLIALIRRQSTCGILQALILDLSEEAPWSIVASLSPSFHRPAPCV